MAAPADIEGLSLAALKALVVHLLSKVAEQDRLIADLRQENARLKGLNGRPRIKPSGMEPQNGWFTNSMRSPICTVPRSNACAR